MSLPFSRRELLTRAGVGMGLIGLQTLMSDAGLLAADYKTTPPDPTSGSE